MIEVKKKNANDFLVIVDEKGFKTEHNVELNDEYYQKLTNGEMAKEELVKKSFQFLLERESQKNRFFPVSI